MPPLLEANPIVAHLESCVVLANLSSGFQREPAVTSRQGRILGYSRNIAGVVQLSSSRARPPPKRRNTRLFSKDVPKIVARDRIDDCRD
jgi:hypothetical protein